MQTSRDSRLEIALRNCNFFKKSAIRSTCVRSVIFRSTASNFFSCSIKNQHPVVLTLNGRLIFMPRSVAPKLSLCQQMGSDQIYGPWLFSREPLRLSLGLFRRRSRWTVRRISRQFMSLLFNLNWTEMAFTTRNVNVFFLPLKQSIHTNIDFRWEWWLIERPLQRGNVFNQPSWARIPVSAQLILWWDVINKDWAHTVVPVVQLLHTYSSGHFCRWQQKFF